MSLKPFTLMPLADKKVCQECGVDHPSNFPHDAQSLYYQYKFFDQHGRWPNWDDALEHCTEEMKVKWKEGLKEVLTEREK